MLHTTNSAEGRRDSSSAAEFRSELQETARRRSDSMQSGRHPSKFVMQLVAAGAQSGRGGSGNAETSAVVMKPPMFAGSTS
jgi:hypothetical protein